MLHKTIFISFISVCCCYFIKEIVKFCGHFFSVGRLKLSKFGILKQAEGNGGFRKITQGGRKGCFVNHALWWVINGVHNYGSLLMNCA